ncbi:MAG: hypothetical protein ABSF63_07435 [Candidatus Bathyarchaeia archaeon]|jgi:hypothetical protein
MQESRQNPELMEVAFVMTAPSHFVHMTEEEFLKEAIGIVEKAQSRALYLRLIGALAVYVHSADDPPSIAAFKSLGRLGEGKPTFTDLDLVLYSKQRKGVIKLLEEMKFKADNMVNWMFGGRRLVYNHPEGKFSIDLFVDKLEFSHDVNFTEKSGAGRLELDYPTITLEDIVLEKLQIHQINRKDLVDLIVLLLGHTVADQRDKNVIDGGYIARTLSDDWGFWYDATKNLASVATLAQELTGANPGLAVEQSIKVKEGTATLRKMIDAQLKSKNWEKREKVGTSKPWYKEVGEVSR